MNIDPNLAKEFLDSEDVKGGVNQVEVQPPITSLGKARTYPEIELSAASESYWKPLAYQNLPSQGLFYPENSELLIRSAKTLEIRHWSTIDENDPIDVKEKINFILNSCTRFKVKGDPKPLNFNDFLEIDRYHILFRIYELTFPNQENKLFANIKCKNEKCGHINRTQVLSKNLKGFEYPEEVMQWYSPEEKCFVINSQKLNETFRIWMPTIGVSNKVKQQKNLELSRGIKLDDAFYQYAPYIFPEWRQINSNTFSELKNSSIGWPDNKFIFIHKFTKQLESASLNKAISVCEKCKTQTESHIFLGGSFTVKDIFIISAGLNELI
jgi:hypothetical protein